MRDANRIILVFAAAASLAACNKPATENNVAIDINNADPNDIEALPPDESSVTSNGERAKGDDNPDVNALGNGD